MRFGYLPGSIRMTNHIWQHLSFSKNEDLDAFDGIEIEKCERCGLVRSYSSSLGGYLYDHPELQPKEWVHSGRTGEKTLYTDCNEIMMKRALK